MKKLLLSIAAVGVLGFAQAQKVAHLNYDSLIKLMPETKTATQAAEKFLEGLKQELATMQTEMQTKYDAYLKDEANMSDLIKKSKQNDLQQLQTRIQDFQTQAEAEYKRKYSELTIPIMEKAKKGIEAAAKEGGYKYVLDTSPANTAVLYSEMGDDLLMAVKKKLDGMPAANIPAISGAGEASKTANPSGTKTPPVKTGGK
jgi:outer membrane protein